MWSFLLQGVHQGGLLQLYAPEAHLQGAAQGAVWPPQKKVLCMCGYLCSCQQKNRECNHSCCLPCRHRSRSRSRERRSRSRDRRRDRERRRSRDRERSGRFWSRTWTPVLPPHPWTSCHTHLSVICPWWWPQKWTPSFNAHTCFFLFFDDMLEVFIFFYSLFLRRACVAFSIKQVCNSAEVPLTLCQGKPTSAKQSSKPVQTHKWRHTRTPNEVI